MNRVIRLQLLKDPHYQLLNYFFPNFFIRIS